jgi:hypothetical protein
LAIGLGYLAAQAGIKRRFITLRDRAVTLGWPIERIRVIDSDLGQSGASSEGRDGFQQLVAAVANGKLRAHGPSSSKCWDVKEQYVRSPIVVDVGVH